jgi:hypothetical protein
MIIFSANNGTTWEFNSRNIISIWKGVASNGRMVRIYTVDGKVNQFETGATSNNLTDEVFDSITLGE